MFLCCHSLLFVPACRCCCDLDCCCGWQIQGTCLNLLRAQISVRLHKQQAANLLRGLPNLGKPKMRTSAAPSPIPYGNYFASSTRKKLMRSISRITLKGLLQEKIVDAKWAGVSFLLGLAVGPALILIASRLAGGSITSVNAVVIRARPKWTARGRKTI